MDLRRPPSVRFAHSCKCSTNLLIAVVLCIAGAASAHASPIEFSPGACYTFEYGSCTATAGSSPGANPALGSLSISSTTQADGVLGTIFGPLDRTEVQNQGTLSSAISTPEIIDVSWDFFVNATNAVAGLNYYVNVGFSYNPYVSTEPQYSTTGSVTIGSVDEITGSTILTLPVGTVYNYDIDFIVQGPTGGSFTMTVPADSSIDLNVPVSATPEPGSLILTGTATLFAALRYRSRRLLAS